MLTGSEREARAPRASSRTVQPGGSARPLSSASCSDGLLRICMRSGRTYGVRFFWLERLPSVDETSVCYRNTTGCSRPKPEVRLAKFAALKLPLDGKVRSQLRAQFCDGTVEVAYGRTYQHQTQRTSTIWPRAIVLHHRALSAGCAAGLERGSPATSTPRTHRTAPSALTRCPRRAGSCLR